jgi:hypothetical protein
MPLLYDALVPIGRVVDENNVGIEPLKGLRCVDLLRELFKPGDDGIETRWLTLKHAIRNHLFVVGSKSLQERCSRKQA